MDGWMDGWMDGYHVVSSGGVVWLARVVCRYGMGYQNCTEKRGIIPPVDCPGIYKPFGQCGFREDHAVNLYTSSDLVTWTFVGDIFGQGDRPTGIYFRCASAFACGQFGL